MRWTTRAWTRARLSRTIATSVEAETAETVARGMISFAVNAWRRGTRGRARDGRDDDDDDDDDDDGNA